jgi:hypothetical protein
MDNGSHFINMYIASICSKFGIKHNHTSAYNPQANGLVERLNQTIANSLKRLDPSVKQYWDNFIPAALYAYRTLRQSTTKYTPFYLTYGRNHNPLPLDTNDLIPDNDDWTDQLDAKLTERINDQIRRLLEAREDANKLIKEAQNKQQLYLDRKLVRVDQHHFNIGDQVLLHHTRLENQLSGKLEDKWQGPYYIHDIVGNRSYKIRRKDGMILSKSIHGNRLKLHKVPAILHTHVKDGDTTHTLRQ